MKLIIEPSFVEAGISIIAVLFYVWRNKNRCYLIAKIIHLSIAISGLLLVGGGFITEYFEATNNILEGIGEILGVWLALLLIPAGALFFLVALLCWNDIHIVIPTVLLAIFLAILWYANGLDRLVSVAFIVYAVITMYLFLGKSNNDRCPDSHA